MLQTIMEFQREIYLALAEQIKALGATGDWMRFAAFLPMALMFGAAHALTPGHSKAVLATYLAGADASVKRGLLTALMLSFTHVTSAVIISLLALPLVSVTLGSAGRAPLLEDISRGLLGVMGAWMLWRAARGSAHTHQEGQSFGFLAGLVPCPLTLFVMTFATVRGVPAAGLMFAVMMMAGVALTLCMVALAATLFRRQLTTLLAEWPRLLAGMSRGLEAVAGTILVAIAIREIVLR